MRVKFTTTVSAEDDSERAVTPALVYGRVIDHINGERVDYLALGWWKWAVQLLIHRKL